MKVPPCSDIRNVELFVQEALLFVLGPICSMCFFLGKIIPRGVPGITSSASLREKGDLPGSLPVTKQSDCDCF